ncbi:MAG: prephenate dehydrogenase [Kineosporiaceae bacterium]
MSASDVAPVVDLPAPVLVVGTGLLGTSIALGLRHLGVPVLLDDPSPTAVAVARDLGGGQPLREGDRPGLVVVAAPPDVTADVVVAALRRHRGATVTDVASVKSAIAERVAADLADDPDAAARYVGGHPMAGRERSGAVAARADLFVGRPWVVCQGEAPSHRVRQVLTLAQALGAQPVTLDPATHDAAVAIVSHVPQVAASLVAARLREAPEQAVALAGQGLRDVTRIAGSDPLLWAQILAGNAAEVARVLSALRADLDGVIEALSALGRDGEPVGARGTIARAIADGNAGRDRIPGKHGSAPTAYALVVVLLPDRPGQLGRLFADIGAADVNVEEFTLEHSPGQPVGLAHVWVLPAARDSAEKALTEAGWRVVG